MADLPALPQIPSLNPGSPFSLPPELMALLGPGGPAMQGQMADLNNTFDAAFSRANQLANTANQIGGQYGQLLNQPWPMTNKWGDFATNLAGNISQAIAPHMNGQALAQNTIQRGQEMLSQTRVARLQALKDNYDKMADAALRAGDLATQQKMLQKAELMEKNISELATTGRAQLEARTQTQIAAGAQQGETHRLQMSINADLVRTLVNKGAVLREGGDQLNPSDYIQNAAVMSKAAFAQSMRDITKPIMGMMAKDIPFETAMQVNNTYRQGNLATVMTDEINNPVLYAGRILRQSAPAPIQPGNLTIPVWGHRFTWGSRNQVKLINTVGEYKQLQQSIMSQYSDIVKTPDDVNGIINRAEPALTPAIMKAIRDGGYSDDTPISNIMADVAAKQTPTRKLR